MCGHECGMAVSRRRSILCRYGWGVYRLRWCDMIQNLVCFDMTDGMVVSIIGAAVLFRVDMIGESILSVICMGNDID